ncbi:MAG TPA: sulfatase-like hydrolase/transferase [Terriglobia bacterium]
MNHTNSLLGYVSIQCCNKKFTSDKRTRRIIGRPSDCVPGLSLLDLFSLLFAAPAHPQATKPSIVFILVDDTGWGDFSVYGGTTATPRIDKLASEGIRSNNYNVEVQCTPTRPAIMTGRRR